MESTVVQDEAILIKNNQYTYNKEQYDLKHQFESENMKKPPFMAVVEFFEIFILTLRLWRR